MKKVLAILGLLLSVLPGSLYGQFSMQRTFAETGGSVSTGSAGTIATLSQGDVIVINERYTNFSQKGIQCFRLEKGSLKIVQSKAYFNGFTVQNLRCLVKNDSIYLLAQHNNGGNYRIMFLVFDSDLNLVRSVIHKSSESLLIYSFLADPNGSFRVYGAVIENNNGRRFVQSLSSDGTVFWSKRFGDQVVLWGGSVMLPNGDIVASAAGKFVSLNRNGGLVWARSFGDEFDYSINGGSADGNAIITRSVYDSALIYSIRVGSDGQYKGQTQGVWMNQPVFSNVLLNGHILVGSSTFAENNVFLKISELDDKGVLVTNHRIDNVFGYAPTGAIYDACKYATHVDASGNFYVLGVANRQGFFVLRLEQDLAFDCGYTEGGSEPSPVVEQNQEGEFVVDMPVAFIPYPFTEETAGTYQHICTGCGSEIQQMLFDSTVCLSDPSYTFNAGNQGAKYLWSDGSTSRQITVHQSGDYWVRIMNDCDTLLDTVTLVLNQKPLIAVQANPEISMPFEDIVLTGQPDTFSTMHWYYSDSLMGNGNQYIWKSDRNGNYTWYWEVYDDPTCRTRDSLVVRVSLIDYYFPTGFSPNKDGLNDGWGPVGSGIVHYTTTIYNRWGQRVFSGENQLWDGTFNGVALVDGHYMYRVELINDDGVRKEYKGVITLLN